MIKLLVQIFIAVFLFAAITEVNGQGQNRVWCFGDSVKLHFNKSGIDSISKSSLVTRGTCVSICDSMGDLLFYAETQAGKPSFYTGLIWNKEDKLMENGDSIAGRGWYKQYLVIPNFTNDSLFVLFSASVTGPDGFYYSIIDMSQDSGRGAVVQKNVQLQGANFYANDGITAIKHGNGRDLWVMVRDWKDTNNVYFFYEVTPNGIALSHTQAIGDSLRPGFFRIEPSNDGSKISCCNAGGLISVFDFDRCTGYLSNEISIEKEASTYGGLAPWYWDCELSANKQYLYVSQAYSDFDTTNYLLRFDLQAPNIQASRDTLYAGEESAVAGLIELAPDGKIYWACAYNPPNTFFYPYPDSVHNYITDNLSVINYPDSSFCDFQPFSFNLGGKRTYYGLPNNPNYELGPLVGSACDTLSASMQYTPKSPEGDLKCTFVGSWQKLFVNAQNIKGKDVTVTIYDARGSLKFEGNPDSYREKLNSGYVTLDVDCAGWSEGMYVVSLQSEKESLSCKFVKQ